MGILQEKVTEYKHLHIPGWIILINNGLVSRRFHLCMKKMRE